MSNEEILEVLDNLKELEDEFNDNILLSRQSFQQAARKHNYKFIDLEKIIEQLDELEQEFIKFENEIEDVKIRNDRQIEFYETKLNQVNKIIEKMNKFEL